MKHLNLLPLACLGAVAFASSLTAQTNVAAKDNGGSIEVIEGKDHAKETAQFLIDGNPKTRAVFFPPEEAGFRIRFFKPMAIDRVKLLKAGGDSTYTVKDILIKTSSGKEIPVTLPQEGYRHRDKQATPEFVSVDVNDTCDYIDVIVQSAYKTGKEYTAMYEIMAETSEDISSFLEVRYNAETPHYIMRTKYEPEPMDESAIDPSKVVNGRPIKLGPDVFPKTIFSPIDIAYYQGQIRTNKQAEKAYAELIEACERYLRKDIHIPTPEETTAIKRLSIPATLSGSAALPLPTFSVVSRNPSTPERPSS